MPGSPPLAGPPAGLTRRGLFGSVSAGILVLPACASTGKPADKPADTIALPVFSAWVDGRPVRYITTDASDPDFARQKNINYAPRLAAALPPAGQVARPAASVLERVYMFHDQVQINVFQSAPLPFGPGSLDQSYSPLWRGVMVRWLDASQRKELRSEEAILQAEERGWLAITVMNLVVNCPVVANA